MTVVEKQLMLLWMQKTKQKRLLLQRKANSKKGEEEKEGVTMEGEESGDCSKQVDQRNQPAQTNLMLRTWALFFRSSLLFVFCCVLLLFEEQKLSLMQSWKSFLLLPSLPLLQIHLHAAIVNWYKTFLSKAMRMKMKEVLLLLLSFLHLALFQLTSARWLKRVLSHRMKTQKTEKCGWLRLLLFLFQLCCYDLAHCRFDCSLNETEEMK